MYIQIHYDAFSFNVAKTSHQTANFNSMLIANFSGCTVYSNSMASGEQKCITNNGWMCCSLSDYSNSAKITSCKYEDRKMQWCSQTDRAQPGILTALTECLTVLLEYLNLFAIYVGGGHSRHLGGPGPCLAHPWLHHWKMWLLTFKNFASRNAQMYAIGHTMGSYFLHYCDNSVFV